MNEIASISGLIISFVMLNSGVFSKRTAYVRIASSIFDFGIFIPGSGTVISIFAVLLLLVWDILVALRLFPLGRREVRNLRPVVKPYKSTLPSNQPD